MYFKHPFKQMATGPVLVGNAGQQVENNEGPSTSIDVNYLPDLNQPNTRRHSMKMMKTISLPNYTIFEKRRYSVDLHRTRVKPNKNNSFALSYSDHPSKFQRSNTDENSVAFDTPPVDQIRLFLDQLLLRLEGGWLPYDESLIAAWRL
ncbi:hypothetical protein M3Y97_00218700 [Aphelenchoides bicaudatus]|nr:hypothetical protein M3Y97_00218700 [Aphelenchoides bicaudatus]